MDEGRIPKDLHFGELAIGKRSTGRPALRYKDVCRRDLKAGRFDHSRLETATMDRKGWRAETRNIVKAGEEAGVGHWREKRQRRKALQAGAAMPQRAEPGKND